MIQGNGQIQAPQLNHESDGFNAKLQNVKGQIESIRSIKMITDSEYDSIQQLSEDLSRKNKEIDKLVAENEDLKKAIREKNDIQDKTRKLEQRIDEYKKRLSWFCLMTIWVVLVLFAACSLLLLIGAVCSSSHQLIPLLIGGVSVLLILAVSAIIIGSKAISFMKTKSDS